MEPRRRQFLVQLLRLADLSIMAAAFFLAASAVSYTIQELTLEEFLGLRIKLKNFLLFPLILLMWNFVFSRFGLYGSRRLSTWREDVADILKATALGTAGIVPFALVFQISLVTPAFLAVFLAASSALTVLYRIPLRFALWKIRVHGRNLRFIAVVGTNSRAIRFAKNIEDSPWLGYRILGFVDDPWKGMEEFRKIGFPLASDLRNLPDFLRTHVLDEVFVCLPLKSYYEEAERIVDLCENQGIVIRFLSDIFDRRVAHSRVERFHGDSMVTFSTGTMDNWPVLLKRVFDVLVSLVLLAALSPLFLLAAALIKAYSPGTVFFHQDRMGINKRIFRVHKFRTMVRGAEDLQGELEHLNEADGAAFKIRNDPRVTPIGRILRKTSIDELPQLFNVLKGEMSLVGPRPLPVRDFQAFDQDWHRRRFSIRPGITCLWQISGRS
ncbi:MAG: sugar transferase, partial [Deltaproteobacteria bacterium]|nr:sugar transferase [Deltaproteobacteria bacterium]